MLLVRTIAASLKVRQESKNDLKSPMSELFVHHFFFTRVSFVAGAPHSFRVAPNDANASKNALPQS